MSERTREDGGEPDARSREYPLASSASASVDPFDRVYGLGDAQSLTGGALGLVFACSSHVAALACAITLFQGAHALAATTPTEVEIEVVAPTAPPPPPPAPPPEATPPPPDPTPPPPPPKPDPNEKEDPYEEDDLPPPPSEAAKILTAPSEPNEPKAPADQTFASGEGTGLGVGFVAGGGTGNGTTYDPRARVGNKTPTKRPPDPATPPPGYVDLSRPAAPYYGVASGCEFPDGADDDTMVVPLVVTVGPEGQALAVEILRDPGQGFGAAARTCAMRMKWRPGRDASGKPIVSKTSPVKVRFTR